jgi:phage FluMu protein Com
MPIDFRCSQCGKLLRVADGAVGRQATCPECGALTTVPRPQSAGASPFGPSPTGPPPPQENPYQSPEQTAFPAIDRGYRSALRYGQVRNYLVEAILCTLFCCLPFGVVAIVFAAQVNGKLAAGDYQGAVEASRTARTWCWVSFWLGLIPMILFFFLQLAALTMS